MSDRFGNIPIQDPEPSPFAKKPRKQIPPPAEKSSRPPGPPRSARKKKSTRQAPSGKIWILPGVLAILIASYCALGFLGVPYYLTRILPANFHEKSTMVLEPATVTFNPFTFRLQAGDWRIRTESGATLLSLHSLQADIAPLAIFRGDMVSKTFTINGLELNVVREPDGSYNFQPIFGTDKHRNIAELIKASELPFFFSLNNISITGSKITFNDKPAGKIHTAEKIELDLPTLANTSFQTDHYLRPHFSAVVNGSPVELSGRTNLGQTTPDEQETRLAINVQDLELPTYGGYLPFTLPMACTKGTASGKIDLLFAPHNTSGDKLSIGFQLQITGAELIGKNELLTVVVPTARVSGSFQPVSATLQLNEVALKEPILNSFGDSLLDNIGQTTHKDAQTTPEGAATEKDSPSRLTLELLLVDKGVVRFFPHKNDQQPASIWKTIQLSIKNYHSGVEAAPKENNNSVTLSGERAGSSASFSWQGKFSSPDTLTGMLRLHNFDGKELLKAVGDNHPFTIQDIQGFGELKGQLVLYTRQESPHRIRYKLNDAEVSLKDFALLDKEQSLLRAPVVKFTGLNLIDETIEFGNIQVQNGVAEFIYGRLPKIYREFTTKKYRLHGLDFEGKVLVAPEKKPSGSLTFSEVSLKANALDSAPTTSDNLSLSATTAAGGIIKAQGKVTLTPFAATLKTGFRQLPAKDIQPFFSSAAPTTDVQGELSGKGLFSLPAKSFAGDLELSDVSGKGPQKMPFAWKKSIFQDVHYTKEPFHFGAAFIAVDGARFSWQITRNGSDPMHYFSDVLKNYLPATDKQSSSKTESPASVIDIEEISFTTGTVDVLDHRLTPEWLAEGASFAGSINNIHAAASAESRFSFTGKLADSPFTISGKMKPFAQEENGSFHFLLKNFPLSSLAKQLAATSEIGTTSGQLQLTLDCAWQERQYISSGTLALAGLKPAASSSGAALSLALLTNSAGTIEVPFNLVRTAPVAQSSLVEELATSMQRLLLKGSVSPLLLAAGDFTDLIGNESIEFRPGEFILTDNGQKTLNRYAALLLAHPGVGLTLSGGVNKQIDGQAMKKNLTAVEQLRVDKENEKLFNKWQEQKNLYLKQLDERQKSAEPSETIFEQDIPAEALTDFKPLQPVPVVVGDAMLLELAHKRIDITYQYLTTQNAIQPERISTVLPDSLPDEPEKLIDGVAITLTARNQ
ncbi:DUF748 domain-containing protein [Desulfopila sp. IMCC35006]|uniref:DUF748 domain-containing protein n=1 Tax=Desulfopila sp. IMCC35006 TaxID=2569542 RepID=UPI0010AD0537|nr:DUF748 domain-containing protein [Desulfopila sp. IMCC35006]TKB26471.1 DUF748 domain-containing protein [Desulfopila sp. IMCC35006]